MINISLSDIRNDFSGFQKLINLYNIILSSHDAELKIDMSHVNWMEANMCAPLGAILYKYDQTNKIIIERLNPKLEKLLQRNGFLPNFGFNRNKIPDSTGTTIEYKRFEPKDSESFKDYVASHFVGKGIPDMSKQLHRKFRESIAEIFENAAYHSQTVSGIFTCGQHFPGHHRLDFSIVDLGIGIRELIHRKIGLDLSAEQAIIWAVSGINTTRQLEEGRPGGLGLKLLKEFITLNKGKIQIISDRGYWLFENNKAETKEFISAFPGTVVNIEINTADTQSYRLSSEIDINNIF